MNFFELLSTEFAACSKPPSRDNYRKLILLSIFSLEGQDNDQIKEVCEEKGTKEEKRQLTEAEEKPDSSQEIGTQLESKQDEENGDAGIVFSFDTFYCTFCPGEK